MEGDVCDREGCEWKLVSVGVRVEMDVCGLRVEVDVCGCEG